ncbi:MAG: HD domain-containing protein [Candidatus Micrarchaeia archaeon]
MKRIADFLLEIDGLKLFPRTGWFCIGVEKPESVSAHVFGAMVAGYVLAGLEGADRNKVIRMILIHDISECRTGDLHRTAKKYAKIDERRALADILSNIGDRQDTENLLSLFDEFCAQKTKEAIVAKDADTLDFIAKAVSYYKAGNKNALRWALDGCKSLKTKSARRIAKLLVSS